MELRAPRSGESRSDGSRITCMDLFERDHGRHAAGGTLPFRGSPDYERIGSDRAVAANDAANDPRLAELREAFTPVGL